MIRIAAMADVHFAADAVGTLKPHMARLPVLADLLLIAGDLTRLGTVDEVALFIDEIEDAGVPTFAVLGNHDYHGNQAQEIRALLADRGIRPLDGEGATVDVNGACVGIAGVTGFGGGFLGACASEFGEPEMKAFVRHTKRHAARLELALKTLACDLRIALLHYSPIPETLQGERLEIYPFLGSYLLAEAVDRAGADLVIHGHAHEGHEIGKTPGGIHVRNVAQPVIRRAYALYYFDSVGGPLAEPQVDFSGWQYLAH